MTRLIYIGFLVALVILQAACGSSGGGGDNSSQSTTPPSSNDGSGTGNLANDGVPPDNSGSDTGGNDAPRSVNKFGSVEILEDQQDGIVTAKGTFFSYSKPFEVTVGNDNPPAGLINTCTVSSDNGDDGIDILDIPEPGEGVERTFVDAGESISVSSNGSEYLTLLKAEVAGSGFIFYSTGEQNGELKPGIKVTVPGAEFPAFSDIAVADVGGFKLDSPSNGSAIRFDTKFSWQAGSNPDDVIILISASGFNNSVSCFAKDTGSFEYPKETQDEMGTGFFGNELNASRIAYKMVVKDDAALVVYSISQ